MVAVAALLGAGFAAGAAAVLTALLPTTAAPRTRTLRRGWSRQRLVRLAVAVACAAAVAALTRWPVAAALAGFAAYTLPVALGAHRWHTQALARTEAVATWAEMLRDNLSAAAGLEQTIITTAPLAPQAIREQVNDVAAALRLGTRLPAALTVLRDRLEDPTGQLVARALSQASQHQSRQLAQLLSELATRARARANLRLRVGSGHARVRTNARIIIGFTLAMAAGLVVFNRPFLDPYNTALGQLVLLLVGAVFAAGITGITRLARTGLDPRQSP
jgi:Flp pilus assembly protein TadB